MTDSSSHAAVLCLASASPRRRALLQQIGVEHVVVETDIDEDLRPGEAPDRYVARLAVAKAQAAASDVRARNLPVLGADTAVVVGGLILGKPDNAADAARMLGLLQGREHQVLSAVALLHAGRVHQGLSVSSVRFAALTARGIADYVASGEPFGKAGGYAIQGRAARFVAHLDGSYSGVMGLPLYETANLLADAGVG